MAAEKVGFWSHFAGGAAKALGGGFVSALALWLWDDARHWVWGVLVGIGAHFSQSYTLSMWTLYLLAIPSIAITVYWAVRLIQASKSSHRRFRQVSLFGALWRWQYDISGRPRGLLTYCQACDMQMVYRTDGGAC